MNRAAWLHDPERTPLQVGPAEMYKPEGDEVLVKNGAVALNPVDKALQMKFLESLSTTGEKPTYPFLIGQDLAGTVIAVGPDATKFKVGDRVVSHAMGSRTLQAKHSAFQNYTIVSEDLTFAIPDSLSFEQAAVLPLGLSTAATAMYLNDIFGIPMPSTGSKPSGDAILIWGGSTSVGANAIQLAKGSGLTVYSTSSPKNFDLVKKLGATKVFDYNSESVVEDVVSELGDTRLVGVFDCASKVDSEKASFYRSIEILRKAKNSAKVLQIVQFLARTNVTPPDDIKIGETYVQVKGTKLASGIYGKFVPEALQDGSYIVGPPPRVIGKGVEYFQEGLDAVFTTSGEKIVVSL